MNVNGLIAMCTFVQAAQKSPNFLPLAHQKQSIFKQTDEPTVSCCLPPITSESWWCGVAGTTFKNISIFAVKLTSDEYGKLMQILKLLLGYFPTLKTQQIHEINILCVCVCVCVCPSVQARARARAKERESTHLFNFLPKGLICTKSCVPRGGPQPRDFWFPTL
jgi:hypothetical protein